jgi:hypothetical protein
MGDPIIFHLATPVILVANSIRADGTVHQLPLSNNSISSSSNSNNSSSNSLA